MAINYDFSVDKLHTGLRKHENEKKSMENRLRELVKERTRLENQYQNAMKEHRDMKERYEQVKETVGHLHSKAAVLRNTHKTLEEQNNQLKLRNDTLKGALSAQHRRQLDSVSELETAATALANSFNEAKDYFTIDNLKEELKQLTQKLKICREKHECNDIQIEEMTSTLKKLQLDSEVQSQDGNFLNTLHTTFEMFKKENEAVHSALKVLKQED